MPEPGQAAQKQMRSDTGASAFRRSLCELNIVERSLRFCDKKGRKRQEK